MYHLVYRIRESKHIAVMSALLLFSALQFWYISHAGHNRRLSLLLFTSYLWLFYLAFAKNDKYSMVKAYGAAALAVVTKGPVGIVLPGLILLLFIAIRWFTKKIMMTTH